MRRSRQNPQARRTSASSGKKQGGDANLILIKAQDAQRRGRENEAMRLYRHAALKIGNQPQLILSIAQQLEQTGATESAIAFTDCWMQCFNGSPVVRLYLANLLFQEARTEEALDMANTVLDQAAIPAAGCLAALCCEHLNRLDDAKRFAETAVKINPDDPQAIMNMAHLDFKTGNRERAIPPLERILRLPHLHAQLRSKAWHELGMIYESMGDSARAFAAFTNCGTATKQTTEYARININRPLKLINQYRCVCSAEWLTTVKGFVKSSHEKSPQLAFLIGFPRSGTTMTEQILCAHSLVHSVDERPYLHDTRIEAQRMTDAGNDAGLMLKRLSNDHVIRLRKSYFQRITTSLGEYFTPQTTAACSTILIDKLPLNLLHLPFIIRVFPDSRIIMALRDPRDVCLSCLMQDFRLNSEMAHFLTLPETARFYDKVMSFYLMLRPLINIPMIELRYEDTVADLPGQSHRLTDFLGIPWEENMLRFHEQAQRRNISTPSYEAVRKPINRKAVARWKGYQPYFEEVQQYLQRFIEVFGYED